MPPMTQTQHEEDDDGPVVDGPFGKIEACHHSTSVSGFTRLTVCQRIDAGGHDFLPCRQPVADHDGVRIEFKQLDVSALHLAVIANHPDLRLRLRTAAARSGVGS